MINEEDHLPIDPSHALPLERFAALSSQLRNTRDYAQEHLESRTVTISGKLDASMDFRQKKLHHFGVVEMQDL